MKKLSYLLLGVLIIGLFGYSYIVNDGPKDEVTLSDLSSATNTLEYANMTGSKTPISVPGDNPYAVLCDSSQLVSHPGQGFGGADASAITTGGTLYGFGAAQSTGYSMGDDFVVPEGFQWQIDSIKFFSYQTGSTTTSTITGCKLAIFSGNNNNPDSVGSTLHTTDTSGNKMKSTYFTNIYRVTGTALTNNQRPIMAVVDTVNVTLGPGTYWMRAQFAGTLTSGPWAPPRTIAGQLQTGNCKQKGPTGWAPGLDGTTPQGLPFVIYGTAIPSTPPSWTEQTSGLTTALYSVSAINDNIAWTCGAQGKVLRTTDKGQTWVNVSGNIAVANPLYNIWGIDANNAIVIGDPSAGAYVWKTTNGGTNWVEVLSQTGGFLNAVWMTSSTNGFMTGDPVGGRWSLWKTNNGGSNWDSAGLYVPTTQAGWNNSLYISGSKIWFGTNAAFIMYSSDNGATWGQQTTPATNSYIIWFNNDNVGLSGGTSLYVTTNGGGTWSSLTSPVATSVSGITGSGTEWWVTPMSTPVYYSSNNGANWTTQYTAPAGSFYHLTKARTGNTIWGVRSNGGISRYGSPLTGVTPIVTTNVPENYTLSQNYPNPFNPITRINFSISRNGFVTLKIYDVLGREITTLVNEVKNAGNYIVDFNASNLSSGVYFYKLEVNGFADVKKMTLVK